MSSADNSDEAGVNVKPVAPAGVEVEPPKLSTTGSTSTLLGSLLQQKSAKTSEASGGTNILPGQALAQSVAVPSAPPDTGSAFAFALRGEVMTSNGKTGFDPAGAVSSGVANPIAPGNIPPNNQIPNTSGVQQPQAVGTNASPSATNFPTAAPSATPGVGVIQQQAPAQPLPVPGTGQPGFGNAVASPTTSGVTDPAAAILQQPITGTTYQQPQATTAGDLTTGYQHQGTMYGQQPMGGYPGQPGMMNSMNPYATGNPNMMQNGGMPQQPGAMQQAAKVPLREDHVRRGVGFIKSEHLQEGGRSVVADGRIRTFLLEKGLTDEEVTEAFNRHAGVDGDAAGRPSSSTAGGASRKRALEAAWGGVAPPPPSESPSTLSLLLQATGAAAIGAAGYAWLVANSKTVYEWTGFNIGIGGDGSLSNSVSNEETMAAMRLNMQAQSETLDELRKRVDRFSESYERIAAELDTRHGEMLQTVSALTDRRNEDETRASDALAALRNFEKTTARKLDELLKQTAASARGDGDATPARSDAAASDPRLSPVAEQAGSNGLRVPVEQRSGKQQQATSAESFSSAESASSGRGDASWKAEVRGRLVGLTATYQTRQEAEKMLNMLFLIVNNLKRNASQEKYRKVNPSSSQYKTRLGDRAEVTEFLEYVGFVRKEKIYVWEMNAEQQQELAATDKLPMKEGVCPAHLAADTITEALASMKDIWREAQDLAGTKDAEGTPSSSAAAVDATSVAEDGGAAAVEQRQPKIRDLLAEAEAEQDGDAKA
ncbi:unnamed protein product [Amoebophrya sp. A25]|nr:unnamed protein product [Amoebophrya sp. A25]|eukprot:GSA25T00002819001.1